MSTTKKTLDTHHSHVVQQYQSTQEELSAIRERLSATNEGDEEAEELRTRLAELEAQCAEEVDYYLNTGGLLFQYYDILEKSEDDVAVNIPESNKGILKFFIKTPEAPPENTPQVAEEPCDSNKKMDKAALLEKYLQFTADNYVKPVKACGDSDEVTVCPHCGCKNRVTVMHDSMVICNDCQFVDYIIVDHDKPSYKESSREISYFSYRRLNHTCNMIFRVIKSIKMLVSLGIVQCLNLGYTMAVRYCQIAWTSC